MYLALGCAGAVTSLMIGRIGDREGLPGINLEGKCGGANGQCKMFTRH